MEGEAERIPTLGITNELTPLLGNECYEICPVFRDRQKQRPRLKVLK